MESWTVLNDGRRLSIVVLDRRTSLGYDNISLALPSLV